MEDAATDPSAPEFEKAYLSRRLRYTKASAFHPAYLADTEQKRDLQIKTRAIILRKFRIGAYKFNAKTCPICDGRKFLTVSDVERCGLYFPMAVCTDCGLVQANPVLDQAAYIEFYSRHYRKLYGSAGTITEESFRHKAATRSKIFYERLGRVGALDVLTGQDDLVVEVGCGDGSIVAHFHEQGRNIVGIDLDDDYMKVGRSLGYALKTGTLDTVVLPAKPKLIYYHHVLEHIADLNEQVIAMHRVLADDGLVAIVVPGVRNAMAAFRDLLAYLQVPHVFNFSLHTLEALMSKHGFELVSGDESILAVFRKTKSPRPLTPMRSEAFSVVAMMRQMERAFVASQKVPPPASEA